jgi:hypothetical protein
MYSSPETYSSSVLIISAFPEYADPSAIRLDPNLPAIAAHGIASHRRH